MQAAFTQAQRMYNVAISGVIAGIDGNGRPCASLRAAAAESLSGRMVLLKAFFKFSSLVLPAAAATLGHAAQLSTDARTAIPHDVQQLVVIDYRVMQNSPAAMDLRDRVMPPELKQFDDALRKSGLNDNHDVDQLAFALFRPKDNGEGVSTLGIAQGQFSLPDIIANFKKQKLKYTLDRTNKIYPLTKSGMVACFVDESTLVFGGSDAVKAALDARDGNSPNLLTNGPMMDAMKSVDAEPLWSILDQKGTQTMMGQVLGEAGSLTDFNTVRKRLDSSWYSMDFQHGVKFDLTISTGDPFAAATISSLLNAAIVYRKMSGSDAEKQALGATDVHSDSGLLSIHFATTDTEFASLLQSPLFQSMVH
jgi:hypothetical protein